MLSALSFFQMSDADPPKRFIGIIAGARPPHLPLASSRCFSHLWSPGTSLDGSSILSHLSTRVVHTQHGSVSIATDGSTIAFVRRHHAAHFGESSGNANDCYQHPDKINYAAIACALASLGVTHVIAACSVGSLKPSLSVGSLLVPSDYFAPWTCVSVHSDKRAHIVPQLDPQLRAVLLDAARELKPLNAVDCGVYVQTQGPRFETKAEISFLQGVGDVVGMTGAAEVRPSSRRSNCTY
jgi:5'-methylthioadenosine phosphorylase